MEGDATRMRRSRATWVVAAAVAGVFACSDRVDERAEVSAEAARQQLSEILGPTDPLRRAEGLGALLPRLGPEALPFVLEAFERSSLNGLDPDYVLLATWWARFDPMAALDWATRTERATSYAVIAAVFRAWARDDPKAAWAEAASQPGQITQFARAAVIAGWEESEPSALIEHIRAIPDLSLRQQTADSLAQRRVLTLGADSALRWVDSLPPDGFRSELEPRVVSEVALVDPAAATAWVEPRIATGQLLTGFPRRVATRWVRRDPQSAMAWLKSLPAGRDRDDGVMESFRDWQLLNRAEATSWIAAQEREPWLEPALALYADELATERPEEALALVAQFRDQTLRDRFTTTIAREWLSRDYAAAQAWLQNAKIPEEVRERIRVLRSEDSSGTPARSQQLPTS
ncbi:MAG: hypothetical protein ACREI7_00020 [Myxococcota bacterium]